MAIARWTRRGAEPAVSAIPVAAALASLLSLGLASQASAQPQTPEQVDCILAAQQAAIKVFAARHKVTLKCMKTEAKAGSVNVSACANGDPNGKVAAAVGKATDLIAKAETRCVPPPDYGFTSAAGTTGAAVSESRQLTLSTFGTSIAPTDKPVAKCIGIVGKALGKLAAADQKFVLDCQRSELLEGSVTGHAQLSQCIFKIRTDPSSAILKAREKLEALIAKKCDGVLMQTLVGGECSGESGNTSQAATCLQQLGDCRSCSVETISGALGTDCDVVDDALQDGSCTVGTCGDGMKQGGELCDPSDPSPSNQVCPNSGNGLDTCNSYDCSCQCPGAFDFTPDATAMESLMDRGWTGLAHDERWISGATVTVRVTSCDSATKPCGTCGFRGPFSNIGAGSSSIDSRRCSNDSSIDCGGDEDCGSGTCLFYFGAPLPLNHGGEPVCVLQKIAGSVTGTVEVATGESEFDMNVLWDVYAGVGLTQPCPRCAGDAVINDGIRAGVCAGGSNDGLSCDGMGLSPIPGYGPVSLDCPPTPAALISGAGMPIDMSGSTASESVPATPQSPACRAAGFAGDLCFCDVCDDGVTPCSNDEDCTAAGAFTCGTTPAGEPTAINACTDPNQCQDSGDNDGTCATGPNDRFCDGTPALRLQCANNADCQALNAECPGNDCGVCALMAPRECFPGSGSPGDALVAAGAADVPTNESSTPLLAATMCTGPTVSASRNAIAGLPGPMRINLRGLARARLAPAP